MKITIIGATGFLGKPVTEALIKAGFDITIMAREADKVQIMFPKARVLRGDLANKKDIKKALENQDAVYLNFSVKQGEKQSDFHTEQQGIDNLLEVAKQLKISRIAYLSSLVKNYQGINNFDWWVFRIKNEAVEKIKNSGISYTIFYPSVFMENLETKNYRQGNFLLTVGKSEAKMWWISAVDYANQVVKSFQILTNENREYTIQGEKGLTTDEAMAVFKKNYSKSKLSKISMPIWVMKLMGNFNQNANYGYLICEALNKYPEKFEAEQTWKELGKPQISLADYAKSF